MDVYTFTHPKHQKTADTADGYDGPLTPEGKAMVKAEACAVMVQSILRRVEDRQIPLYCGIQTRHLQTRDALGLGHVTCKVVPECGNDPEMFALIENGDETILTKWIAFLEDCKAVGREEIFVVTSRLFPLVMLYILRGGASRFGTLRDLVNSFDAILQVTSKTELTLDALYRGHEEKFSSYAQFGVCCNFLLNDDDGRALRMLGQGMLTKWKY